MSSGTGDGRRNLALRALSALVLVACGGGDESGQPPGTGTGTGTAAPGCVSGEALVSDGTCLPAGTQPNGCAAGEMFVEADGSCLAAGVQSNGCAAGELWSAGQCVPAGVPPDGCADGFLHDGDHGCVPVLPSDGCAAGQMAVPGETACREVAPCGSAPWGVIPVDGATVYVDAAASGPGDGSSGDPYPTIQAGIDAAMAGAIVAVAEGSYAEDLVIEGKPVRLWGRCPARVEIVGASSAAAAVLVSDGADDSEIHSLAVRGAGKGISSSGSTGVSIEQVWVHDTASFGVDVVDRGPGTDTSVEVRGVLVERAREQGVWLSGVAAEIEGSVVRDTLPTPSGYHGWGVTVLEDETTFRRGSLTLRSSLVQGNDEIGVLAHSADAVIEATAILDTLPGADQRLGRALVAQTYGTSPPADVTVTGVVIDDCHDAGIMVGGSHAVIANTVVRNVLVAPAATPHASGIVAQHNTSNGERSTVELRHCLVERASDAGVFIGPAEALIEGVLVRDTQTLPDGTMGRGMVLQRDPLGAIPMAGVVRGSVVDGARAVGVFLEASDVTLEGVAIRNVEPQAMDDAIGWGVFAQDSGASLVRANLTMRSSLVEWTHGMGVVVAGSDANLEGVLVRDVQPRVSDRALGRGMNFQDNDATGQRSNVTVRASVLDNNQEVGLFVAGADAVIEATVVRDTRPGVGLWSAGRGAVIEINPHTLSPTTAAVRWSLIERNYDVGLLVAAADVVIESTSIRDTYARSPDGGFGDGLAVFRFGAGATAEVRDSRIESSARGGVASFSGNILLGGTAVVCNDIDLNGESTEGASYEFSDLGGNTCGCATGDSMCRVLTSNLEAPEPSEVDSPP